MSGYVAPSVTAAGLVISNYTDILNDDLAQFQKIYGANVYLGTDSAQYQWNSVIALKIADLHNALQLVYNNQSPATAVGAGLDRVVKLNGIARLPYTYSTALLTITGTAGTVINNGAAQDANSNQWLLPATVTIPSGGSITVTATCTTAGNITAGAGTINIISTPQAGWSSVTNAAAATPGNAIETDSQLRARQAISVALPSQSMLDSIIAAIAAVPGVTRYNVLENDTNVTDSNGNPPHSITAVVEGGTELAVATAIYVQKSPGVLTNGTTTVPVTDPNTLLIIDISYDLPTYVPIYVDVPVYPLSGWTSSMQAAVQTAVVNYLNGLAIGEIVTYSGLVAAAMAVNPSLTNPAFSVRGLTLGLSPSPSGNSDISVTFNEVSEGVAANVSVTILS